MYRCLSGILFLILFLMGAASAFSRTALEEVAYEDFPSFRVCCAFGYDLYIPVVPFFTLSNTVALKDLFSQEHVYGGDLFESNGIIYTCRGGFIDTGHLRDVADWTAYFASWLKKSFYPEAFLPLPDQGTEAIQVILTPMGRKPSDQTLIHLAQRMAFEYSVWHEIATLFGYSYFPFFFQEMVSAFSPEDLYSNLLGAYIGARALQREAPYERAVRLEMIDVLKQLVALDEFQTRRALDAVEGEGRWWHRERVVSDNELVTRRYVDYGNTLYPWLISKEIRECRPAEESFSLKLPVYDGRGYPLSSYYQLAIYPDSELAPAFFGAAEPPGYLTSNDFYWIMGLARQTVREMLGAKADRPD